jgi:hypothetical protein
MRLRDKFCLAVVFAGLTSFSAYPAETVILRNGFSIHCERREDCGEMTRLYISGSSASFAWCAWRARSIREHFPGKERKD